MRKSLSPSGQGEKTNVDAMGVALDRVKYNGPFIVGKGT
jgi:hypothetical protein